MTHRQPPLLVVLLAPLLALTGCDLVFGVGSPTLQEPLGGGGSSGGLGGQGGDGGDGGTVGSGGSQDVCVGVSCPSSNPCVAGACDATGECQYGPWDRGEPEQQVGDCKVRSCADGLIGLEADPSDPPEETANPCTTYVCEDMEPLLQNLDGAACNDSGVCFDGLCNQCFEASECGTDTSCVSFECDVSCSAQYAPYGTDVPELEFDGDCKNFVCDGVSEAPVTEPDPTDPFDDGNDCTDDVCVGSEPQNQPRPAATDCAEGVCDGQGHCVECVEDAQCEGDLSGFRCLSDYRCGCLASDDCRGPIGKLCLSDGICGCKADSDCPDPQFKRCNKELARCEDPLAPTELPEDTAP